MEVCLLAWIKAVRLFQRTWIVSTHGGEVLHLRLFSQKPNIPATQLWHLQSKESMATNSVNLCHRFSLTRCLVGIGRKGSGTKKMFLQHLHKVVWASLQISQNQVGFLSIFSPGPSSRSLYHTHTHTHTHALAGVMCLPRDSQVTKGAQEHGKHPHKERVESSERFSSMHSTLTQRTLRHHCETDE